MGGVIQLVVLLGILLARGGVPSAVVAIGLSGVLPVPWFVIVAAILGGTIVAIPAADRPYDDLVSAFAPMALIGGMWAGAVIVVGFFIPEPLVFLGIVVTASIVAFKLLGSRYRRTPRPTPANVQALLETQHANESPESSAAARLDRLAVLRESGWLSDEEFEARKARILAKT